MARETVTTLPSSLTPTQIAQVEGLTGKVDGLAVQLTGLDSHLADTVSSLSGPGVTPIDSYTSAAVSAVADTANQTLVSAPGANKQIWVYGLMGTTDTGAGTISLQDQDDLALSGVISLLVGTPVCVSPSGNFAMPWFKVATNKALEIDTVTCGFKGTISYAVVSV